MQNKLKMIAASAVIASTASAAAASSLRITVGDETELVSHELLCELKQMTVVVGGVTIELIVSDRIIHVNGVPQDDLDLCPIHRSNGGGSRDGNHDAVPASQIAEEVYGLPGDVVEEIDPGPPVDHGGVVDTDDDGSSDDEADEIVAEGVTQGSTQPEPADEGESSTNGGNAGVDIF